MSNFFLENDPRRHGVLLEEVKQDTLEEQKNHPMAIDGEDEHMPVDEPDRVDEMPVDQPMEEEDQETSEDSTMRLNNEIAKLEEEIAGGIVE